MSYELVYTSIHSSIIVTMYTPAHKTLIDVCVCVRRHIAKLRQEWFNGLSWNFVGMLGVTMPRMYQILVTNQLNSSIIVTMHVYCISYAIVLIIIFHLYYIFYVTST